MINYEDIQTCRMFDITMDELKSSNNKNYCYACGYDAEYLVKQITELEKKNDKLGTDLYNAENIVSDLQQQLAEKDLKLERLKQNYDEVWEDTYFSVEEEFKLNNNCNECQRYYAEEFNKQLKKERKKFIKSITKFFKENFVAEITAGSKYLVRVELDKLNKFLDQIQGETK